MARPERLELPTLCSGGTRSIQLSYGRGSNLSNPITELTAVALAQSEAAFHRCASLAYSQLALRSEEHCPAAQQRIVITARPVTYQLVGTAFMKSCGCRCLLDSAIAVEKLLHAAKWCAMQFFQALHQTEAHTELVV